MPAFKFDKGPRAEPGLFVYQGARAQKYKVKINKDGRTTTRTLGDVAEMTLSEARKKARAAKSVKLGTDTVAPTISSLMAQYEGQLVKQGASARYLEEYRRHTTYLPRWMHGKRLDQLTKQDFHDWHRQLARRRDSAAVANAAGRSVRAAARWWLLKRGGGMRLEDLPVNGVEWFRLQPKTDNVFKHTQIPEFFDYIGKMPKSRALFYRLAILSGLRKSAILSLRTDQIMRGSDGLPERIEMRPDQMKSRRAFTIWAGPDLQAVLLDCLAHARNGIVCWGDGNSGAIAQISNVKADWFTPTYCRKYVRSLAEALPMSHTTRMRLLDHKTDDLSERYAPNSGIDELLRDAQLAVQAAVIDKVGR